jgi:PTH1 family peptidyl-tRNA hydrolase
LKRKKRPPWRKKGPNRRSSARKERKSRRRRKRKELSVSGESLELKIIVGLGNPGKRYRYTRHNMGFAVIDALARARKCRFSRRRCRSLIARTGMGGCRILLAKPTTFVNLAGEAVACILRRTGAEPSELFVIADDVNLSFGKLRIRARGGDGGHKGLRSIISNVRTEEFPRLRVGVGSEDMPDDLTDYVLGGFSASETNELPDLLERCCRAVETIVFKGIERAMNEFN